MPNRCTVRGADEQVAGLCQATATVHGRARRGTVRAVGGVHHRQDGAHVRSLAASGADISYKLATAKRNGAKCRSAAEATQKRFVETITILSGPRRHFMKYSINKMSVQIKKKLHHIFKYYKKILRTLSIFIAFAFAIKFC